ncbi:hypothetical protein WN093_14820 [Gammaproteobacteria bacterium AS21]
MMAYSAAEQRESQKSEKTRGRLIQPLLFIVLFIFGSILELNYWQEILAKFLP